MSLSLVNEENETLLQRHSVYLSFQPDGPGADLACAFSDGMNKWG